VRTYSVGSNTVGASGIRPASKLADEVRAEMAIKYLRETDLSLDEVAAALGFNEVANFRHAFSRWTKATPGKFMNMHGPHTTAEDS